MLLGKFFNAENGQILTTQFGQLVTMFAIQLRQLEWLLNNVFHFAKFLLIRPRILSTFIRVE